jgi:hypothetical protein
MEQEVSRVGRTGEIDILLYVRFLTGRLVVVAESTLLKALRGNMEQMLIQGTRTENDRLR